MYIYVCIYIYRQQTKYYVLNCFRSNNGEQCYLVLYLSSSQSSYRPRRSPSETHFTVGAQFFISLYQLIGRPYLNRFNLMWSLSLDTYKL